MGRTLQSYRKLFEALRKKGPLPMYLLYGPEEYIKKEFLTELIQAALPGENRAFNLDIFHGDDFDRDSFSDRVSSFPLFAERRMVVLKKFEALSTPNKDFVLENIGALPQSMTFVAETSAEKMDTVRMKNLKKLADARGMSFAFQFLSEDETVQRVKARLRKEELGIEPEALDLLVASVGTHLSDLVNEVDKIILSVGGAKVITSDAVADVVGRYRTDNLFAVIDRLGQMRPHSLVARLNRLLDGGEEPILVLAMLIRRVVLLLEVRALTAEDPRARSPKVIAAALAGFTSPYFAGKLIDQASRFTTEELDTYLKNLRWADNKLKSTSLPPRGILETALVAASMGKTLAQDRVWL
jgi:DNA polymerase-3 subunit delta